MFWVVLACVGRLSCRVLYSLAANTAISNRVAARQQQAEADVEAEADGFGARER